MSWCLWSSLCRASLPNIGNEEDLATELALVFQRNISIETTCKVYKGEVYFSCPLVLSEHALVDQGNVEIGTAVAVLALSQIYCDAPCPLEHLRPQQHPIFIIVVLGPWCPNRFMTIQAKLETVIARVFQSLRMPDGDKQLHCNYGRSTIPDMG